MTIYLGLMSGTSMDGIDAALVDVDTHQCLAASTTPYEPTLMTKLQALIEHDQVKVIDIFQTHRLLGEAFASAANTLITQSGIDKAAIKAIGSHGQTILHAPDADPPLTVQLGCGHTLATRTGLTVVNDFRTRDMVLGGQGAPLAPLYHQVVFETLPKPLVILNLGGIANITLLFEDGRVKGYDVGPGNALMDAWIKTCLDQSYDHNGAWALRGEVQADLLETWMQDPFFALPAPKSLDKGYFTHPSTNARNDGVNIQATLAAWTAQAAAHAIRQEHIKPSHLLVCGGGVHNLAVMKHLQAFLPDVTVASTATQGVDPDYLEAMMCAWLAAQRLQKKPLKLANITGGITTVLGSEFHGAS